MNVLLAVALSLFATTAVPEKLITLATKTEAREFKAADGDLFRYRWHQPKELKPGATYPLVILMHGAGERGTDNLNQLFWGAEEIFAWFEAKGEDFFFVAGQVTNDLRWVEVDWALQAHQMPAKPSKTMAQQIELIEKVFAECPVDRSRVYVTGVSMGGYGTWDLICRKPAWFAAAMPVCGGGDIAQAWKLRTLPIWIHHGDKDTVVPFVRSRRMTAALWACDGNVKYTEYPGVGHDSWRPAYGTKANLDWFFAQRKK